jgi:MFS transporter, AAHS family, 4-hydroxybenzoate transporter
MINRDVEAFTRTGRIGGVQAVILMVCLLAMTVDGFDLYVAGILAPVIAGDLQVPAKALTRVFVAQQVGVALGAIVVGPIADRYGRRGCLTVSLLAVGLLTLATPLARSTAELAIFRGLCGVFISGVLPAAMTLTSEFAPKRWQASSSSVLLVGYTLGAALTGAVVAVTVHALGWRGAFYMGGAVATICGLLVGTLAPESLQFRARRNPFDPRISRLVARLDPYFRPDGAPVRWICGEEVEVKRAPLLDVFRGDRGLPTQLLWTALFLTFGLTALVASWASTFFLQGQGVSVARYGHIQAFVALAGIPGTLAAGPLIERLGFGKSLVTIFVAYSAATVAVGMLPFGGAPSVTALACQHALAAAGTAGLAVMAISLYPPAIRATGFGWSFGVGRVGAIVGPVLGGALVASGLSLAQNYALLAIAPAVTALLVLALAHALGEAQPLAGAPGSRMETTGDARSAPLLGRAEEDPS